MNCWAGLLYHGGAWWVMSARDADPDEVIRELRRAAPGYRRDRLMAVRWSDQDESDYQLAITRGGYMIIREPA